MWHAHRTGTPVVTLDGSADSNLDQVEKRGPTVPAMTENYVTSVSRQVHRSAIDVYTQRSVSKSESCLTAWNATTKVPSLRLEYLTTPVGLSPRASLFAAYEMAAAFKLGRQHASVWLRTMLAFRPSGLGS